MKQPTTTESALLSYLRDHHPDCATVEVETDLIASGQLDSLVVLDLVHGVESQFGIRMSPREVSPQNMRSISQLASFVDQRLSSNQEAA